ncbi:MAG: hypoxanthine phosphoribosyltransferase [Verrucomicrobia bacterium 61-8]|nr:hypoxanthine phosphoribosyltransferase [Verrucomicrobiota bacterium]OJV03733.1 MAG: hypoxanthine phosphoribosyltransferase [Verrucomicrobia bacterium 61-8]
MIQDISEVLFDEATILHRLDTLARKISAEYEGKDLTVVALLTGSVIFMADLLRRIPLPLQVDCLAVSSYHGTQSKGTVTFRQTPVADLSNRHVLILDDILDTGITLRTVLDHFAKDKTILSLKSCVLLRKLIEQPRKAEADFVAFDIPNAFVVGYGLDYNERYRNLPLVGVLSPEAITRYAKE